MIFAFLSFGALAGSPIAGLFIKTMSRQNYQHLIAYTVSAFGKYLSAVWLTTYMPAGIAGVRQLPHPASRAVRMRPTRIRGRMSRRQRYTVHSHIWNTALLCKETRHYYICKPPLRAWYGASGYYSTDLDITQRAVLMLGINDT